MVKITGIAGNLRAIRFNSFKEEEELMENILAEEGITLDSFKERYEYSNGSIVVLLK
jgi:hypothetical protein